MRFAQLVSHLEVEVKRCDALSNQTGGEVLLHLLAKSPGSSQKKHKQMLVTNSRRVFYFILRME